jgi:phytol kinase
MSQNILGLLASFGFIFATIGVSTLLSRLKWLDGEGSRKFIHIAVGHWWFIAMAFFESALWASVVPLSFVIINYLSYKYTFFKAMERSGGKEDLGTVYYAVALLILAYLSFSFNQAYLGGIGILTMAYADGFAAIVGKRFPSKRLIHNKTLAGSATVFVMSGAVAFVFLSLYQPNQLFIHVGVLATAATLIELFSPRGFDNLTLPLGVSLIATLMRVLG